MRRVKTGECERQMDRLAGQASGVGRCSEGCRGLARVWAERVTWQRICDKVRRPHGQQALQNEPQG